MSRVLLLRQERAFERLYRRHVGDVYRYALVVLRDPDDAENVTQTTFVNAYRSFSPEQSPRPNLNRLLAIAHDLCRRRVGDLRFEDAPFVHPDGEPTANDVRRALARLPFDQRTVLAMREVEGRSYGQIAEILAMPIGTVETLIFRARQSLREEIDGALTCHEAELAVSRELDGRVSRKERRLLRAHLQACVECELFAHDQRAQQHALRQLASVEVPKSLDSLFGSQRRRVGVRVAIRGAAVAATTALVLALLSSGGVPRPAVFIGEEQEPDARAAVVKKKQNGKRKIPAPAASPW